MFLCVFYLTVFRTKSKPKYTRAPYRKRRQHNCSIFPPTYFFIIGYSILFVAVENDIIIITKEKTQTKIICEPFINVNRGIYAQHIDNIFIYMSEWINWSLECATDNQTNYIHVYIIYRKKNTHNWNIQNGSPKKLLVDQLRYDYWLPRFCIYADIRWTIEWIKWHDKSLCIFFFISWMKFGKFGWRIDWQFCIRVTLHAVCLLIFQ